jgi:amino acid transporter
LADDVTAGGHEDELVYESAGLPKTTNWWGAFVIGLAGTILVTGIAPVMVTELGAASIPVIVFITITGYIVCLLLAELSAMMPDRSGGLPSYAYPAYKDRWPRFAEHVNGFTAWAYWLGWFPVAPLNMILASFYIVELFSLNATSGITPIHTFIAWWTIGISVFGLIVLAIPAIRGLRFGTAFATGLAMLSMIPLTFLAISWIFNPSVVDFGQLTHFRHTDGSGFFSPLFGHGWLTLYIAFSFLLTWNVIAMEAAACYIGETKNPDRDAKIAMNLEGAYGLFIYTMIPVAFVIVLGLHALGSPALVDPKTMFVTFAGKVFGTGASSLLNWLIGIMLILALILSALNAITGTARSLHQMATDGQFPKWFTATNHHGVPHRAMIFNVICSISVVFLGGAVEIYTFSNVGYLASFIPVLVGYFLLRRLRPNVRRPFKLPEWMKWVALAIAGLYTVIYFYGGPVYANCACNAAGRKTLPYYFIGIVVVLMYFPLWAFRKYIEDRRSPPGAPATAMPAPMAGASEP